MESMYSIILAAREKPPLQTLFKWYYLAEDPHAVYFREVMTEARSLAAVWDAGHRWDICLRTGDADVSPTRRVLGLQMPGSGLPGPAQSSS